MSAKCPACKTVVSDHESEQAFPSVVNVKGYKGLTAHVKAFTCRCGHKFTAITYEPEEPILEPRD